MYERILRQTVIENESKILLLVMDGLGGLPSSRTGKTELEEARKPNMDRIAERSSLGLSDPIGPGITPGSGPAHLALFGYDPLKWEVGRGILSALGVGFQVTDQDLTARGNFATLDEHGVVIDRRAGRISTAVNRELVSLLDGMRIGKVQVFVQTEKEHRIAVIFRGDVLSGGLTDSDPQVTGEKPHQVRPLDEASRHASNVVNIFLEQAAQRLAGKTPANGILLRGFAKLPSIPSFRSRYKMRACAIATYPMYKGLARLVGMEVMDGLESLDSQVETLGQVWPDFDFFFVHYKKTDSKGEDGDFQGKVIAIEEVDPFLPAILNLSPDVFVLTGDHSTPSSLKMHSWHPVPVLLRSEWVMPDGLPFHERACARWGLGRIRASELMPLMMANARRLEKYGA